MRYKEFSSIRGTFLLFFVVLVLVNRSVLSDHVLQRRDLLQSFCLGGGSEHVSEEATDMSEDVLSEIALLDMIFKVLTKGPTLNSLVSFTIIEGAIVLRSRTSGVIWFCFRMLYSGLTFDGFEDVLDRVL